MATETPRQDPHPARRRRESPDVRTEQILDAAERLLTTKGLGVSMAEIAQAAGVAKGTVYLYFASKDDLVAGLRARYLERFAARLAERQAAAAARGHLAAIEEFALGLFDWSVEHAALHHVLFHEAGTSEADAMASGRAALEAEVRAGVETGEFTVSDPELAAGFLLDGIHAILVAISHHPERRRFADAVTELVPRVLGCADGSVHPAPMRESRPGLSLTAPEIEGSGRTHP